MLSVTVAEIRFTVYVEMMRGATSWRFDVVKVKSSARRLARRQEYLQV